MRINNAYKRNFVVLIDNNLYRPDFVGEDHLTYSLDSLEPGKHKVIISERTLRNSKFWFIRILNPVIFLKNALFKDSILYKNQDNDKDVYVTFDLYYNENHEECVLEYNTTFKDGYMVNSLDFIKSNGINNVSKVKPKHYIIKRTLERIIPPMIVSIIVWMMTVFSNDYSKLIYISIIYSLFTVICIAKAIYHFRNNQKQ